MPQFHWVVQYFVFPPLVFQSLAPIPNFRLTFGGKQNTFKYMEALAHSLKPWPCPDKRQISNLVFHTSVTFAQTCEGKILLIETKKNTEKPVSKSGKIRTVTEKNYLCNSLHQQLNSRNCLIVDSLKQAGQMVAASFLKKYQNEGHIFSHKYMLSYIQLRILFSGSLILAA